MKKIEVNEPMNRLVNNGTSSLTDIEIISLIIGDKSHETSKRIYESINGDLTILCRQSIGQLVKIHGIGKTKAASLVAAFEISKRKEYKNKKKITSSKDGFNLIGPYLSDLEHEEFWVLLMNRANEVKSIRKISSGGVAGTVVDAKILFKIAIEELSSAIILAHNHPSGNLKPSDQDLKLTQQIKECGKLFEIQVLDHIIVAKNNYYSFADEGNI
jgi:DNA repair protein RadC